MAVQMRIAARRRRFLSMFNRVCPAKNVGRGNIFRQKMQMAFGRSRLGGGGPAKRAADRYRPLGFTGQGSLLVAQPFDDRDEACDRIAVFSGMLPIGRIQGLDGTQGAGETRT